ncbi:MAG TPA: hypothetical protein VMU87_00985 [Stellaceae bacterium]|nr:hypothetical protein [Stellaceae bacterium]
MIAAGLGVWKPGAAPAAAAAPDEWQQFLASCAAEARVRGGLKMGI